MISNKILQLQRFLRNSICDLRVSVSAFLTSGLIWRQAYFRWSLMKEFIREQNVLSTGRFQQMEKKLRERLSSVAYYQVRLARNQRYSFSYRSLYCQAVLEILDCYWEDLKASNYSRWKALVLGLSTTLLMRVVMCFRRMRLSLFFCPLLASRCCLFLQMQFMNRQKLIWLINISVFLLFLFLEFDFQSYYERDAPVDFEAFRVLQQGFSGLFSKEAAKSDPIISSKLNLLKESMDKHPSRNSLNSREAVGGITNGCLVILLMSSFSVLECQGEIPKRSSQNSTPRAKISVLTEYRLYRRASGGMQRGVPTFTCSRVLRVDAFLENPKSASFQIPFLKKILAGLISRWIISCSWRWLYPFSTSLMIVCFSSRLGLFFFKYEQRSPPSQYSVMMKQFCCVMKMSKHLITLAWSISLRILISSCNISKFEEDCFLRVITLIAMVSCAPSFLVLQTLLEYPYPIWSLTLQRQFSTLLRICQGSGDREEMRFFMEVYLWRAEGRQMSEGWIYLRMVVMFKQSNFEKQFYQCITYFQVQRKYYWDRGWVGTNNSYNFIKGGGVAESCGISILIQQVLWNGGLLS